MFTDFRSFSILDYDIFEYSSQTRNHDAENIKIDDPTDSTSRWSSVSNDDGQYLILKLKKKAIVTGIYFGKFQKVHVCNIKEMKIYSFNDYDSRNMECNLKDKPTLIFEGGLRNDIYPESFPCNYIKENIFVTSRYIKIRPLQAWGINFNFAIWHVKLFGMNNEEVMNNIQRYNHLVINTLSSRCILKFFKCNNYKKAFYALSEETNLQLEHPIFTKIRNFMSDNKFEEAEIKMKEFCDQNPHFLKKTFTATWNLIKNNKSWPKARGAHASLIDDNKLYVHGGWDGHEESNEFLRYDISQNKWDNLEFETDKRSCHRMTHLKDGNLLILGKYYQCDENEQVYAIKIDLNENITYNLKINKSPLTIYEHQIIALNDDLLIFGGKERLRSNIDYAGFYILKNDTFQHYNEHEKNPNMPKIQKRMGHSMFLYKNPYYKLFDESNLFEHLKSPIREGKKLEEKINEDSHYVDSENNADNFSILDDLENLHGKLLPEILLIICGGQKIKDIYREILLIDFKSMSLFKILKFPFESHFRVSHRACLVDDLIYFLFFYETKKEIGLNEQWFGTYNIIKNKWSEIEIEDIQPRTGYTFNYNDLNHKFYIFGGIIKKEKQEMRLNDLIEITIEGNDIIGIKKQIIFEIRKQKFLKLISEGLDKAVTYLKENIYILLDHKNKKESAQYKKLCCDLYTYKTTESKEDIMKNIISYFKENIREPEQNIFRFIF